MVGGARLRRPQGAAVCASSTTAGFERSGADWLRRMAKGSRELQGLAKAAVLARKTLRIQGEEKDRYEEVCTASDVGGLAVSK